MKKFILTTMFLLFIGIAYTQDVSTDVKITEVERIVDKYTDKVVNAVESIAGALKVPAEHVYSILVKQQVIYGVSSLIFLLLSLLIFTLIIKGADKDDGDGEEWVAGIIFSGASLIGALTWFFVSGIGCLFNPEYGAIQKIMNLF